MFTQRIVAAWACILLASGVLTAFCSAEEASNAVEIPGGPTRVQRMAEELPAVVARIDDVELTGEEFARELEYAEILRSSHQGRRPMTNVERRRVLENVINGRILSILGERDGITVHDEDVRADFELRKRNLPSEEQVQEYLDDKDLSEPEVLALIRNRMIAEQYVDRQCVDLKVEAGELQAEYNRLHQAGILERRGESYDVAHILIQVPTANEDDWGKARKRLAEARQRILDGEDFGDVAREVSEDERSAPDGGLYPETPLGRMAPEFEKVMVSTPAGSVSEPFRTRYGWHILKVYAHHEPGTRTLEEVQDIIEERLMSQKRLKVVERLVREARSAMKVEVLFPQEAKQETGADE